jgi:hypothetical protein
MRLLPVLLLSFFFIKLSAQYPQNYFRHPLSIPMELVANFGEIRTNHWHMGLDIRTQQRENLPVYASAEGYVSRVLVEPGGFGLAIYIAHPNGLTTLYAHMNGFFPALEEYVKQQQYQKESWAVNLFPSPGQFPLKKGDLIGRSGNTGGSAGPHVHFEIRDSKTDKVLNPLLFNFPIADAVPPTISRLAMYDRNKSTYHQSPQLLGLKKSGNLHTLAAASSVKVGSNRISFAVGATDRFSNSANPNGVYIARIIMDGKPVSEFVHDNIDYVETRYMNAQIDYPWKARGGSFVQHISPLPGAAHVAYNVFNDDGIIELKDQNVHSIEIEVLDAKKNTSRIRFNVQYDPSLAKSFIPPGGQKFSPHSVNVFESEDFELYTGEGSVYDTVYTTYSQAPSNTANAVSSLHNFLNATIPVHDSVAVRIKPTRELTSEEKERVIIRSMSGTKTVVQKARWQNGWIMGRFRQFGSYQAFIDNEPPVLNAPPTNLSAARSIIFTPTDNFNVIKKFRAELNGKWLMFSNDKGKRWIYTFDEKFPRGRQELKVTVEDEAGNVTTRVWNVTR